MKTNIQEKLNAILMIAFGLILVVVVSGFSSGFSITQHNDMPRDALPVQVKEEGLVSVGKLLPDQWASSFLDPDTLSKAVREEIKLEMEELKNEVEQALKEIDWEDIKDDVEDARRTVMEEIDWDEIFTEMESARSAMEEIDWEDIRIEVEEARIQIDSILKDFHKDMDFHKDIDQDSEIEKE